MTLENNFPGGEEDPISTIDSGNIDEPISPVPAELIPSIEIDENELARLDGEMRAKMATNNSASPNGPDLKIEPWQKKRCLSKFGKFEGWDSWGEHDQAKALLHEIIILNNVGINKEVFFTLLAEYLDTTVADLQKILDNNPEVIIKTQRAKAQRALRLANLEEEPPKEEGEPEVTDASKLPTTITIENDTFEVTFNDKTTMTSVILELKAIYKAIQSNSIRDKKYLDKLTDLRRAVIFQFKEWRIALEEAENLGETINPKCPKIEKISTQNGETALILNSDTFVEDVEAVFIQMSICIQGKQNWNGIQLPSSKK